MARTSLRRIADVPPADRAAYHAASTPIPVEKLATAARHSSAHAEHYTPPEVIEAARVVLGGIDLDPASSARANRVVRAETFITAEQNGFERTWTVAFGAIPRVFLNPPGGRMDRYGRRIEKGETGRDGGMSAQKAWWFKLAHEYMHGRVQSAIFVGFSVEILQSTQLDRPYDTSGVVLPCPNDPNAKRLPIPLDFPMCFPARRLAYYVQRGEELVRGASPPHASVLVYLPPRTTGHFGIGIANFERVFGKLGRVVRPQRLAFESEVG